MCWGSVGESRLDLKKDVRGVCSRFVVDLAKVRNNFLFMY